MFRAARGRSERMIGQAIEGRMSPDVCRLTG